MHRACPAACRLAGLCSWEVSARRQCPAKGWAATLPAEASRPAECCTTCSAQEPPATKSGERGVFGGTAAILQLRLLEVYLDLPSASAYAKEHDSLVFLCSHSFHATSAAVKRGEGRTD